MIYIGTSMQRSKFCLGFICHGRLILRARACSLCYQESISLLALIESSYKRLLGSNIQTWADTPLKTEGQCSGHLPRRLLGRWLYRSVLLPELQLGGNFARGGICRGIVAELYVIPFVVTLKVSEGMEKASYIWISHRGCVVAFLVAFSVSLCRSFSFNP